MSTPLIDRYVSPWVSSHTIGAEVVYEGPRRQRQLVELAQRQATAQDAAARAIVRSNLAGAEIVARELNQQTSTLVSAMEQVGDRLAAEIAHGSTQIVDALGVLGDRLCASLDEVKWLLAQQGRTLESILATLVESRNNEAQQLVRQGLRHYANAEYTEAGERLELALTYDTTDYQVLLNLAFVAVQKNDATQALKYFRKALSLPLELNDSARSRVLWATARLHYAEREHQPALRTASQAFRLEKTPGASAAFTMGVYAALSDDTQTCLEFLKAAIQSDPTLFARAAIDPDLEAHRGSVMQLLSSMAVDALAVARTAIKKAQDRVNSLAAEASASEDRGALAHVSVELQKSGSSLSSASYSECVLAKRFAEAVHVVVADDRSTVELFRERTARQLQLASAKEALASSTALQRRVAWLAWCWPLAYVAPGLIFVALATPPGVVIGVGQLVQAALFWPIFLLANIVAIPFGHGSPETSLLLVITMATIAASFMVVTWQSSLISLVSGAQAALTVAEEVASTTERKLEILRQRLASLSSGAAP